MNAKDESSALRERAVVHRVERDALGKGGRLVWDFLTLFAERRYAEANGYLAPGAQMLFPGGVVMTDCTELPQRSAALYRWVRKVFERFDEYQAADGLVVYNFGTLQGAWLDGEPFEGVRYIDRFLIRDARIVDQKVWNDLCLAAAARGKP
ncbi:MAG: nuclear transport factor 2 family protein [Burkholderiales bacterium]|nr:MAG: nuclear transport factor 2 family protein [Burkholderiales bacterium]